MLRRRRHSVIKRTATGVNAGISIDSLLDDLTRLFDAAKGTTPARILYGAMMRADIHDLPLGHRRVDENVGQTRGTRRRSSAR